MHGDYQARASDHHAKVLIDIKDSYLGAKKTITLRTPEVDKTGHLTMKERTLNVQIPKGILQGQQIRLAGQGSPGVAGGKPGDLYLEIEFIPHPLFRVEDRNVYIDLPIAPWEAALGAKIKVPTPDGKVELNIPGNTTGGSKLRMKGRGIPGDPPGDIFVLPRIILPKANSDIAKQLYRKMEQDLAFDPRAEMEG
jgi:curved DNA-binding protein